MKIPLMSPYNLIQLAKRSLAKKDTVWTAL